MSLDEHGAVVGPLPDGTYRGIIGTLDVIGGNATLRASHWCDAEDGRHGTCPASRMTAHDVSQHSWYPINGASS